MHDAKLSYNSLEKRFGEGKVQREALEEKLRGHSSKLKERKAEISGLHGRIREEDKAKVKLLSQLDATRERLSVVEHWRGEGGE